MHLITQRELMVVFGASGTGLGDVSGGSAFQLRGMVRRLVDEFRREMNRFFHSRRISMMMISPIGRSRDPRIMGAAGTATAANPAAAAAAADTANPTIGAASAAGGFRARRDGTYATGVPFLGFRAGRTGLNGLP